jgi:hypothetical protein
LGALRFKFEAEATPSLGWLGAGLAGLHLLSLYFWWGMFETHLTNPIGYCWPLFPACEVLRPFSDYAIWAVKGVWALTSLIAAGLFLGKKWKAGWWALLACELLKLFVFAQDYRFMGNYHYILFVFGFVYLFIPDRVRLLPLLWVLVYVSAGALKLNREWLSGAALFGFPPWGEKFQIELQAYVIFMELVIVWLLLSRMRLAFWFAMLNLTAFHVASYFIVGYYYPAVCMVILAFLVLLSRQHFPLPRPARNSRAAFIVVLLFVIAQVRFHTASSDGSLTGVGRIGALNMFDVNPHCEAYAELATQDGQVIEVSTTPIDQVVRIKCDPLIFANFARHLCAQVNAGAYKGERLVFQAYARRSSDWIWRKIYDLNTDCKEAPSLWPQGEST